MDINFLRKQINGKVHLPTDASFTAANNPWSKTFVSHPDIIIEPISENDVQIALQYASAQNIPVAIQSTGHGMVKSRGGGMLINTQLMKKISIDFAKQSATVEAGVTWDQVLEAIGENNLAPITGTSPYVGVMGFMLGGGHGWLSREYGFAADSIIEARIVLLSGETKVVNQHTNADLFWAIKGGSGNFGVVTSLTFKLHITGNILAGTCYFSAKDAQQIVKQYASWVTELPHNFTASLLHLTLPDSEYIPKSIRGEKLIGLQVVCNHSTIEDKQRIDSFIMSVGCTPLENTIKPTNYKDFMMSAPKLSPAANLDITSLQAELTNSEIDQLVLEMNGDKTFTPIIEIRYWQGMLSQSSQDALLDYSDVRFSVYAIHSINTDEKHNETFEQFQKLSQIISNYSSDKTFLNFISDTTITRRAFDHESYAKLLDIKKKYDRQNLLRLNHNID